MSPKYSKVVLQNSVRMNKPRDWQAFERLVRDVFGQVMGDIHCDLNGRTGQRQHGVDVFCREATSRKNIGVQCRGRDDGDTWERGRLSEKELVSEVAKARNFFPKLDRYVMLTTGPNDANLKRVAAELSYLATNGISFEVQVHGWDWLEKHLLDHPDIALQYGAVAAYPGDQGIKPKSKIAHEIGLRFSAALELMNVKRSPDERFTLQNTSTFLGYANWNELEAIAEGRGTTSSAELSRIAHALGINESWLIEGKAAPFLNDPQEYRGAQEQFKSIAQLNPKKIIFVRENESVFDAIIVVQLDEFKWITYTWNYPSSGEVGGTGRHELLEFCCLIRKLYRRFDHPAGCPLYGRNLDCETFMRLIEGEIYAGSIFHFARNDGWWIEFAELANGRPDKQSGRDAALCKAIRITRHELEEYQKMANHGGWMHEELAQALFPPSAKKSTNRFRLTEIDDAR